MQSTTSLAPSPLHKARPDKAIFSQAGLSFRQALRAAFGRPFVTLALLGLASGLSGVANAQSASTSAPPPSAQSVRVTTSMGVFVVELLPDRAPLTVQNFLRYVNEGFYTNTLFHRVVGSFVVQGGGYDAPTLKLKSTHDYIFNESGNGLENKRGMVGMARSGPPHSANSQFFVNLADNAELDPLPTRWGYAVFGRVTEGMDVIDKMGVIATGSMGPFKSEAPLKPIVIEKIEALVSAKATGVAPGSGAVTSPGAPAAPGAGASASPSGAAPTSSAAPGGTAPASTTTPGNTAPTSSTPPSGTVPTSPAAPTGTAPTPPASSGTTPPDPATGAETPPPR